jgi:hypothetical protein
VLLFGIGIQQAAVQNCNLLGQHPPDNEQRLNQRGQIGKISCLMRASNLTAPTVPTLSPKLRKVPRRSFSMAMAFDKLAMGQQHPQLLTT